MRCFEFYRAESLTQTSRGNDGLTRGLPGKSVLAATGFFWITPFRAYLPKCLCFEYHEAKYLFKYQSNKGSLHTLEPHHPSA